LIILYIVKALRIKHMVPKERTHSQKYIGMIETLKMD